MMSMQDLESLRAELALAQELVRRPSGTGAPVQPATSPHVGRPVDHLCSAGLDSASIGRDEDAAPLLGDHIISEVGLGGLDRTQPSSNLRLADMRRSFPAERDDFYEDFGLDEMPTPTQKELSREGKERVATSSWTPGNRRALAAEDVTLARAKALTQMALEELRPSEQRSTDSSHVGRLRQECAAARGRIQGNLASLGKAVEGVRALEGCSAEVEDAQSRLRHARSSRWGELAVCERRLEILGEQDWIAGGGSSGSKSCGGAPGGRQALLEALEMERQALLQSRRELSALEEEMGCFLEALAEGRAQLGKQAAERRGAMKSDHAALVQVKVSPKPGNAFALP
ncbi:unnamed protein product, partial [Polarella glacialis]